MEGLGEWAVPPVVGNSGVGCWPYARRAPREKSSEDKSEQQRRPSISMFKASIWKWLCTRLLLRPNLDQRQLWAGGGRGRCGAGWELCMKWKFVQFDEKICMCMQILIIISGEICQFIFPLLQWGRQTQTGAVNLWWDFLWVFSRSGHWQIYSTENWACSSDVSLTVYLFPGFGSWNITQLVVALHFADITLEEGRTV